MDVRSGADQKMDDIMLPGFRFHPTDEELVGFYLRRKILQRALSIELIKQLDIYKYDPWDLPKLATGEKEWYFYCPRDRKYRNSTRPNRVTGAGFWKATGTDRPIYSSEGSKCIGLKKSLVFYKGRAAKGIKTDWMMHEFRLPSTTNSGPPKQFMDKKIPANDSWAICRIFKKASSATQKALSHSWVGPVLPEISTSDRLYRHDHNSTTLFSSNNQISSSTKANSISQYSFNAYDLQCSSITSFCPLDQMASAMNKSTSNGYTFDQNQPAKSTADASSLLLDMSSTIFGDFGDVSESLDYSEMQALYDSFSMHLPQENVGERGETNVRHYDDHWGIINMNAGSSEE
ncbi:hypothetical protein LguiB_024914 [Lonicera macranthoides]